MNSNSTPEKETPELPVDNSLEPGLFLVLWGKEFRHKVQQEVSKPGLTLHLTHISVH